MSPLPVPPTDRLPRDAAEWVAVLAVAAWLAVVATLAYRVADRRTTPPARWSYVAALWSVALIPAVLLRVGGWR